MQLATESCPVGAAVGMTSEPMMDASSGKAAEEPAPSSAPPEPVTAEPVKLHSLPQKAAQSTSADSEAEKVGRLLQCPLTKVCPAGMHGKQTSAMCEAGINSP